MKEITIEQVKPEAERVSQFVASVSTALTNEPSKYILIYEHGAYFSGWIFRRWDKNKIDQNFGHSGTHKTRTEACYRFLSIDLGAQLFEFDTELERTEWLQSQLQSSQP